MSIENDNKLENGAKSQSQQENNLESAKKRKKCNEFEIAGRRIFDVEYLFKQFLNGERHKPFDCTLVDMELIKEKRNGLYSEFTLKCKMCNVTKVISNEENKFQQLELNSSVVLSTISTGLGYSQINEVAASMNMPFMSYKTISSHHEKVGHLIRESAWKSMEEAAAEEARIATIEGEVDKDGIPCITVVTDGAWAKRSYNVNYDSSSGVACIVGYKTGKLLFLGIRNKFCSLCSWYENKKKDVPIHKCHKNWNGTSTSMEADIVLEGFKRSMELYNLKFTKMIGDGDSSVHRKLLQSKPYGNMLVQKVECRNHLLRNFAKKIREICNKKRSNSKNVPVPLALRKEVLNRFLRLRSAITKATTHRIAEDTTMDQKIKLLRGDISNAPSHVFGEHARCKEINYFKCDNPNYTNLVPSMQTCGIYEDILVALQRIIDNASSLILNMDNNLAEHYNSIVSKFVGGKRINFCKRGSYEARCEAAALSFNSGGSYYEILHKTAIGTSPRSFTKRYIQRCKKIRLFYQTKRLQKTLISKKKNKKRKQTLPDKDYCPDAHYISLEINSDVFISRKKEILKDMKKSPEEIKHIENSTIGQASNPKWIQERSQRITASNFGKICKMRAKTSPCGAIKTMLYGNFSGNNATRYGSESEARAILEFENEFNLKVSRCGIFIGEQEYYLAASPDGCINEHDLVEVKCPFSITNMTPTEAILSKKITFATLENNHLHLKKNHNYYYQVQGQLAIANKQSCYFIIWSPLGMLVEQYSVFF
ncbi:uncharacterized protein LOC126745672 isoform X2 [Anthonomus grandis grandis]|uniref:uncharacterized protein LOC126743131 isoform X2 n=1 Tax=Anthonomus grandis grandis TaxID=2921223 RepID=UPI002165428A|nr:uncharacterized protein LOC126743131 isoform X2 [Anthonomus grandis grandis]XP_050309465.1 uncharacterized protein LOC126745593 isoform X2 [Anthonomus grandis grandis]XP_050309586.1 uncharacterized protein LOC126745672 isoform X2 [Anthonomus grandis grandis]